MERPEKRPPQRRGLVAESGGLTMPLTFGMTLVSDLMRIKSGSA
jgi:hypothetical protein